MEVLVTGGAGYIGSHACLELLSAGHDVTVVDNYSNSSPESLERVQQLAESTLEVEELDLMDASALQAVVNKGRFEAVMHFAGLKAVGESVEQPLRYYQNNVLGTLNLLESVARSNIRHFVFSSSATVYGDPEQLPLTESAATGPTNPYGKTKWMIEHILEDFAVANPRISIACLRYFNPVGAHKSGAIGEDPKDTPNNLVPYIAQVAVGRREKLSVFGSDYATPDGTGIRDYIHVVDLVKGHLKALEYLAANDGLHTFNLGTGRGYSVLEMIESFEKASGRTVPYELAARRSGDIAACYADPSLAERELGWTAELDIDAMCEDTWRWQLANPHGFE
ncbi:MAG: UDP-glucose 4-epimerase GalE [Gammaproteobacteria bacterium]